MTQIDISKTNNYVSGTIYSGFDTSVITKVLMYVVFNPGAPFIQSEDVSKTNIYIVEDTTTPFREDIDICKVNNYIAIDLNLTPYIPTNSVVIGTSFLISDAVL